MWGIPYVLYNFYLSLYMKSQGITDKQIGFLISLGFISAIIFSMLAGPITDTLGRRKTTLIFDIIGWPCSILIYALAHNFWMFALGIIVNGAHRVTAVSFNLMVIEDSSNEQRFAAFNLINIINISAGLLTPIAGIAVKLYGIVKAERFFLIFAVISMTVMMILRYHFHTETLIGQTILQERLEHDKKSGLNKGIYREVAADLRLEPTILMIMSVVILFNMYTTIGTHLSLYFAPYMSEVLGIEKSMISLLGVANSATMIIVLVFINPVLSRGDMVNNMIVGLILQAAALFLLVTIPENNFLITAFSLVIFAAGFGIFKPCVDSMLAELTEGKTRATIYSLVNTGISILSAAMGLISGYIYDLNPRLIYIISILILTLCIAILAVLKKSLLADYTDVAL
ncbi:MFS transporter [Tepidanaerobacter acetatoxydans]|uniref:MFS transporter n=1 Tax=Tepidanaerobacter acetatoxydans TaxID=499229 RepID=UPI00350E3508